MRVSRSVFPVIILLVLMLLPVSAYADVKEIINKQYRLARDGEVHLKNISGNINVSTWDKDKIKIKAIKKAHSEKDLDKIFVEIDRNDDHISIITDCDKPFSVNPFSFFSNNNWSVHYELTVPEMAEIAIGSVSGRVKVDSIGGDIEINTVSGDIKVVSAGDDVRGKSVSGSIYLEGITGNASAETVSGEISVNEILGQITAKTVSGGIRIDSGSVIESVKGNTVSGGIRVTGVLDPDGVYDLNTFSGGIKMQLPSDSEFDLLAKTASGGIQSDFDILISGRIDSKHINGAVGKGGPRLFLNTFSGSIRLARD
ncbi:MAG: DUF4097 family beta strand repeat-containing protein [Desulfobacteraceae bacterium]|jgi:DUF4097 and DUF4098 domain-containing protein YvlB